MSFSTAPDRRPLVPLFVDLTGRLCVVVGGGALAERRVRTLLAGGATVRVIAPSLSAGLIALADTDTIAITPRAYRAGDVAGAFLVATATDDAEVDAAVAADARDAGCLFNAGSDVVEGDTLIPAEVRRGRLRVAITSCGASPTLSGTIRRRVEEQFGPEWEAYLDALADVRLLAREVIADSDERRAVLHLAADHELMRHVIDGAAKGPAELLTWLRERVCVGDACAGPFVSLVGAGPGDPGLITAKGLARLRECDVLIHDHLVDPRLVNQAPMHAERIYVGKRGGHDYIKQPAINELIVNKALDGNGRRVVRLKGGDPYVFGRGGEEVLALLEAEVPFEVVPGVTSGIAVPASAGIPVTHRGLSTSVTFVTGHEDPSKAREDVDWGRIAAGSETLCIFMGVRNAAAIADGLLAGGRAASEPVAVIRQGTTPQQETLVTTLGELAEAIEKSGMMPPALLVVGAVVTLRDRIGDNRAVQ